MQSNRCLLDGVTEVGFGAVAAASGPAFHVSVVDLAAQSSSTHL